MLRRSLSLFLALLFVLCLASCNKEEETPSPDAPAAETPAEDVPPVEEDDGLVDVWVLTRLDREYPSSATYSEYEHNENGQRIKETFCGEFGDVQNTYTYNYDEQGRLSAQIVYRGTQSQQTSANYQYDENGNLIKVQTYVVNPANASTETEYTYDEQGCRMSSVTRLISGRIVTSEETFEYAKDGSYKVYKIVYKNDGTKASENVYHYDAHAMKVYEKIDVIGGSVTEYFYERTYDDKGRLISCVQTSDSGLYTKRDYTYDEQGRLVKEVSSKADSTVSGVFEVIFDEHSNILSKSHTDAQGVVSNKLVATYTCLRLAPETAERLDLLYGTGLMITLI